MVGGLRDGTYLVTFRAGADTRHLALRRARGRWRSLPAVERTTRCARAEVTRPLFGRYGLVVRVSPSAAGERVTLVARRGRSTVRRSLGTGGSERLRLGHGTWRVTVRAGGREVGTLTARRP